MNKLEIQLNFRVLFKSTRSSADLNNRKLNQGSSSDSWFNRHLVNRDKYFLRASTEKTRQIRMFTRSFRTREFSHSRPRASISDWFSISRFHILPRLLPILSHVRIISFIKRRTVSAPGTAVRWEMRIRVILFAVEDDSGTR